MINIVELRQAAKWFNDTILVAGHTKKLKQLIYRKLVAFNGGHDGCWICKRPATPIDKLSVDHNHAIGQIRGLLCVNCNLGIGMFKDDPDLLDRAMNYLDMHRRLVEHIAKLPIDRRPLPGTIAKYFVDSWEKLPARDQEHAEAEEAQAT